MLKRLLGGLSRSPIAERFITAFPLSQPMVRRFVLGGTLQEALRVATEQGEAGMLVSLVYLGESVTTRTEAEAATQMALDTLSGIANGKLRANISIKPSQLGLDIDADFCRANIERVLEHARSLGSGERDIFVRLDMESSDYVEPTVALVETLWKAGYRNTGTVLQTYLRRTPDDLRRLNTLGAPTRLVKGAYKEPDAVAFPDKEDVDRMFARCTETLLTDGTYPAIATHDERLIDATRRFAFEHGTSKDSFEFQMLYGVRRDLQQRLHEEGYHMRIYAPFGDSWYPYLMRRLAERPANLMFMVNSVMAESPLRHFRRTRNLITRNGRNRGQDNQSR